MSKTKRLLSLLLALCTVFALFAGVTAFADEEAAAGDTSPVAVFTDVTWANPYAEAIEVLYAAKITKGTSETTFGPSENVTRGQVAAFIARSALGSSLAELLPVVETNFKDVPETQDFNKYIAYCAANGAINGTVAPTATAKGEFEPDANVTVLQLLKMLSGVLGAGNTTYQTDRPLTGAMWETNALTYANELGLLDLAVDVEVEDFSAYATREIMAGLILNAICARGYVYVGSNNGVFVNQYLIAANPLYQKNNLSRKQTESTATLDDGSVDPMKTMTQVTKYGELYYRWQYASTGKGITSWRHDDRNEKLVSTVIANPETTGGLPNGTLGQVFKVYFNGKAINVLGSGWGYKNENVTDDVTNTMNLDWNVQGNRYVTNEYTFSKDLASSAINAFCGFPTMFGVVTDETWTGAEIKIYEQRLSGNGEYDLVTGRYSGIGDVYKTAVFDGKADKVIVTYEYLGKVIDKKTASGVTTYTVDLQDAAYNKTELTKLNSAARSANTADHPVTFTNMSFPGEYAIDDYLRVTPSLADTGMWTILTKDYYPAVAPTYTLADYSTFYATNYASKYSSPAYGGVYQGWISAADVTMNGVTTRYYTPVEIGTIYDSENAYWSTMYNLSSYFSTKQGTDFYQYPFNYIGIGAMSGSVLDVAKADSKDITPTTFDYAYKSKVSAATTGLSTVSNNRNMYIWVSSGGNKDWISGTYQEELRQTGLNLDPNNNKYRVWLDKNGYILGGFVQGKSEYAVLVAPVTQTATKTNIWSWVNSLNSDPRSITYYPRNDYSGLWARVGYDIPGEYLGSLFFYKSSSVSSSNGYVVRDGFPNVNNNGDHSFLSLFKDYKSNPTSSEKPWYTNVTNEITSGTLSSGVGVNDAVFGLTGDVVRLWNTHAKVLTGVEIVPTSTVLPAAANLVVEVQWNAINGTYSFAADTVAAVQRRITSYINNSNSLRQVRIYQYVDDDFIKSDGTPDYDSYGTVYLVCYGEYVDAGFSTVWREFLPPNVKDYIAPTVDNSKNIVSLVDKTNASTGGIPKQGKFSFGLPTVVTADTTVTLTQLKKATFEGQEFDYPTVVTVYFEKTLTGSTDEIPTYGLTSATAEIHIDITKVDTVVEQAAALCAALQPLVGEMRYAEDYTPLGWTYTGKTINRSPGQTITFTNYLYGKSTELKWTSSSTAIVADAPENGADGVEKGPSSYEFSITLPRFLTVADTLTWSYANAAGTVLWTGSIDTKELKDIIRINDQENKIAGLVADAFNAATVAEKDPLKTTGVASVGEGVYANVVKIQYALDPSIPEADFYTKQEFPGTVTVTLK